MKINLNALLRDSGMLAEIDVKGKTYPARIAFVPSEEGAVQTVENGPDVNPGEIAVKYTNDQNKAAGLVRSPLTSNGIRIHLKDELLGYDMKVPVASESVPGAISVLNRLYGIAASTLRSRREDPDLEERLAAEKERAEAAKNAEQTVERTPEQIQHDRLIKLLAKTVGVEEFDLDDEPEIARPNGVRVTDAHLAQIQSITSHIEKSLDEVLNDEFEKDPKEVSAILAHKARLYRQTGLTLSAQEAAMARKAQVLRDKIAQIQPEHELAQVNLSVRERVEAPTTEEQREERAKNVAAVEKAVDDLGITMNFGREHARGQVEDEETKNAVFAQLTTEEASMSNPAFKAFAIDKAQYRRLAMELRGNLMQDEFAAAAKSNVLRILNAAMPGYHFRMENFKKGDAMVTLVNDLGGARAFVTPLASRASTEFNPAFEARLTEDDLVTQEDLDRLEIVFNDLRVNNDQEADFNFGDDEADFGNDDADPESDSDPEDDYTGPTM